MSGADLANLVNEAALFAVRRGAAEVHKQDFDEARDRMLMGLKRPSILMSAEEKQLTAYHEGGHALCAYVLDDADPVHKVTILPTGMALGMTQQLPIEEQHAYNKKLHRGHARGDARRPRRRGTRVRQRVDRRAERPRARDRDRAQDGARVGHERAASARWRGARRARCSSATTSCTRATTPTRPRASSTKKSRRSCASRRSARARTLTKYRPALDAIAKGLLERETLDGEEISRLADGAMGFKAGGERKPIQPDTVTPNPMPAPVVADSEPVPPAADGSPNGNGTPYGTPPPPPVPPARPPFTPASGD